MSQGHAHSGAQSNSAQPLPADAAKGRAAGSALSVIVPVLNEAASLEALAGRLGHLPVGEIIVVDGGSRDGTDDALRAPCPQRFSALSRKLLTGTYRFLHAAPGRARQMNAGARISLGEVLVFLHADTTFGAEHAAAIEFAVQQGADYGCFALRLRSARPVLRLVGGLISLRSRLLPSATGDQVIFMRRSLFDQLGGYREVALCEDLDLVRRARRSGRFTCLPQFVETSARRWEQRGVARTIALMWGLRLACHAGVDPALLKRIYEDVR